MKALEGKARKIIGAIIIALVLGAVLHSAIRSAKNTVSEGELKALIEQVSDISEVEFRRPLPSTSDEKMPSEPLISISTEEDLRAFCEAVQDASLGAGRDAAYDDFILIRIEMKDQDEMRLTEMRLPEDPGTAFIALGQGQIAASTRLYTWLREQGIWGESVRNFIPVEEPPANLETESPSEEQ